MSSEDHSVVIVEDEPDLADLYKLWVEAEGYTVYVANNGEEGLEILEDHSIDVVFLDRRMPGMTGDELLDVIIERGYDCFVSMVTAVEPDFDVIDMGFDSYLVKPIVQEDLVESIELLLDRRGFSDSLQKLYSLSSRKALLEAEFTSGELQDHDEYEQLVDEVEALKSTIDETISPVQSSDDFAGMYDEINNANTMSEF